MCIFDVFFGEKSVIGKSVDFIWIFVFIYEESGLDYVFGLGCEMGESVDFSKVLRYWVRYLDFLDGWLKSGDFVGIDWIFI